MRRFWPTGLHLSGRLTRERRPEKTMKNRSSTRTSRQQLDARVVKVKLEETVRFVMRRFWPTGLHLSGRLTREKRPEKTMKNRSSTRTSRQQLDARVVKVKLEETVRFSAKIKQCQPVQGHGFRRGGYQCHCKDGYFFPDITAKDKFYRGTVVEGLNGNTSSASCLPCAKGCTTCVNARPCWHERQVLMRMIVLGIVGLTIFGILVFCCVIYKFRKYMVLRAASPIFLYVMCFGSGLICLSMVVGYFDATEDTCVLEPWLRYIGITVTYSALLLKTYRIAVIFRVKSAKKVNLTDRVLLRRFIPILAVVVCYLVTWTVSARPTPVTMTTIDNLKYNSCRTDWWEYVADSGVFCYLLWGVYLSFLVRNAPSSYNESKHITWAVYNTILFGSSISVIKQVVAVQQGPDVIYIMELIYLQVAVTCMFCLIFVPKFIALYKFHKYGSDMLNERRFQNRTAVMFPFLPMTTVRKSLMDVAVQASPSVLDNELDNSEVQISVVPRQESCVRIDNGVEGMKEDLDHKDQDESDNIATSGNEKTSNDHLPNETLAKNDRKFDTVDNTQPKPTTALNTLHVCQETRRPTSRSGTNLSTFSGDLAKAFDASVINEHKLLKSSASDSGLSTPTAASKKEYGWYVCTGCKLSDGKIHRLRDTINHDALPVHKRQSFPFYVQHTQNKNGLPSFIPRTPCKQTHKRTPAKTTPKLPQYPHLMSKRRNTKMTESEYLN
ncbi:uncharacterized protein LOC106166534 [Lingula anatina]|uniref:Uncharacterized protein LOC106166534 n=1 Tax=Lingula anatina TaxID=7574 RepID=A0A1S3IQV5_LINAN|nr:uncharacterized protein LOC106166534 [Lingula anatina]|eukprot:XP_013400587.1 uncharacterized protein LOC106166534 [Lingula anatina]